MSRQNQFEDSGESILKKCSVELGDTVMTKCINDLKGMDFRNNEYRKWKEQQNKDDYFEMLSLSIRGREHHKFMHEPFTAWHHYDISCSSSMSQDDHHRLHLEELLKCTQLHVETIESLYSNHVDPPDDMMSVGCPACKCAKAWIDDIHTSVPECAVLCRCDTDSPTTAYQLVEHVYRKGKRCEYHKLVWFYVLECAKKVAAAAECVDQRSNDFVRNILDHGPTWKVSSQEDFDFPGKIESQETNGCASKGLPLDGNVSDNDFTTKKRPPVPNAGNESKRASLSQSNA